MRSFFRAAIFALILISAVARPAPLDDKIAAFKAAVQAEAGVKKMDNPLNAQTNAASSYPPPGQFDPHYLTTNIDQVLTEASDPNFGINVEGSIGQIMGAFPSDAVQKTGQDLIVALRQSRKEKADVDAAAMTALLKRVSDEVNKADKAADLDDLLVSLQKYQATPVNGISYYSENQALQQQIGSALEFTKLWQNFLSHDENGQIEAARSDLQNLSQNNYAIGIVPRSKILWLLNGKPVETPASNPAAGPPPPLPAQKIVDAINALTDLEPALQKLNAMSQNDGVAREYAQNLSPMVEVYNDLRDGLPTSVNIDFMGGVTGPGISAKANVLLLNFILQHYFDTYQGTPPGANEPPAAFVDRVKTDALDRQDWPLLKKALTAHEYVIRNVTNSNITDDETAGIDSFLAALNQESAQQYSLAVASYQTALKAANLNIPAKLIGDKLAAIQRDHPKEFNDGMQSFLSPPMPLYPHGFDPMNSYMMNRGLPYNPRMPGYPGGPSPTATPTLVIPGTSASTNRPPTAPMPPAK